jgi:tetratricopeptide (TPR) repeat protein
MFDAVARRLVALHRADPLVIVLDDLQWADEESLAFVDFLAPDAERCGLVVLATVRRGELDRLPRSADVIELGGLPPAEVGLLLTSSAPDEPVDPELVEAVWRHTGGNPFFIGEVDRLLRSGGRHREAAHWRSLVPAGVRSVLVRRFARLPQRASHTLSAAAELGEVVDPPVLASVLECPLDDVLDDLAVAGHDGLLEPRGAGTDLSFAHSLVREAARGELSLRERRDLNRRAADAIAQRYGERAVGQVARHLADAGDPEAPAWAARAGEAAYAASMYAEAAAWFERALDLAAAETAAPLRLRRAEALSRCGRPDEAEAELLDVARAARADSDWRLLGRAALGIGSLGGGFEVRQLDPGQQALLAEAIESLGDEDSALLVLLLARLSIARSLDGDHDDRAALADRALAIARRVGDDAAIGAALGAWCDANAGPADIDSRAMAAAEMLVSAQRCGDAELELLARRLALVAALEAGEIGFVTRHAAAFGRLADRLRLPQFTWYARLVEGMLAHLRGNLERAAELADAASQLGRQAGSANARMLADGALGPAVARDRGEPGWLDRVIEVNVGIPEVSRGHDLALPFRLYTVGYGGTPEDVAAGIPGWAEVWRRTDPHDGLTLYLGFHLARAAAFTGDVELMAETEATLTPYADRFALDGTGSVCYGPVSAALGALAAARGDVARVEQLYQAAIAACRRIGAPLLQARFEGELADAGRPARPSGRTGARRGVLRRDGDVWLVEFAGESTRLKHSKGLADLAVLLGCPDRDVHVFDLFGATGADRSDSGHVIDGTAKAAYEHRIRELTADIESAEERGDDARAATIDEERAALIAHLAAALGLGGRPRVASSDVERARKAVGMRLRDACRRIGAELPDLGRHLRSAVRTGTWCSYRPETPVDWSL